MAESSTATITLEPKNRAKIARPAPLPSCSAGSVL